MKHNTFTIGIVLLFAGMLVCPKQVFTGASEGLLLWFQIILPTLLPFILMTNLLFFTNGIHYISKAFGKLLSRVFCVSETGSFAVVVGFLCGYPMGAKITADMSVSKYIDNKEAQYLLSFCNNTSPMFILNYIVWKTLNREDLLIPSVVILFAAPVLCSFLFRKYYKIKKSGLHCLKQDTAPSFDFRMIDTCIINSFETIVKVGGYIMLFSIILTLLKELPFGGGFLQMVTLPTLEITNGILLIGRFDIPFSFKYTAILALTSFGGICSIAQTKCMIQDTSLKLSHYIIEKLVTALVTSLLALLYLCMA